MHELLRFVEWAEEAAAGGEGAALAEELRELQLVERACELKAELFYVPEYRELFAKLFHLFDQVT